MNKYLKFVSAGNTGKTVIIDVESVNQKILLGQIKWYPHWRCYAFFPCSETLFDRQCMKDIVHKIELLMIERSNAKELVELEANP